MVTCAMEILLGEPHRAVLWGLGPPRIPGFDPALSGQAPRRRCRCVCGVKSDACVGANAGAIRLQSRFVLPPWPRESGFAGQQNSLIVASGAPRPQAEGGFPAGAPPPRVAGPIP